MIPRLAMSGQPCSNVFWSEATTEGILSEMPLASYTRVTQRWEKGHYNLSAYWLRQRTFPEACPQKDSSGR